MLGGDRPDSGYRDGGGIGPATRPPREARSPDDDHPRHGRADARRARRGRQRLLIGIGGSATNDGGAGMAQALGARLLDAQGSELSAGGAALAHLARIEALASIPA